VREETFPTLVAFPECIEIRVLPDPPPLSDCFSAGRGSIGRNYAHKYGHSISPYLSLL
jgi:hypothetical protein